MPDDDVFALIEVERWRAADMFASLTDDQLDTPSLCQEWTVRDIAAHLIGPFCVSVPRFLAGSLVSGGMRRYSARATHRLAGLRLTATDLDWTAGDGPEIRGPG
jgi:Mycothiol maleylpyruvate isomerase N-terminal domain